MKKILAVILCALMLLCFVGCSENAPDGMKAASSENEAFYLYIPTTWTVNSSGGTASGYLVTDYSNVSMTCMLMDEGLTTLDEYVTYTKAALAEVLKDYEDVGEVTKTKLGSRDAVSFEYSAWSGTVNYKWRQVVTLRSDMFYILTYTSTVENFDSHLEEVDKIIENVKFK